RDQLDRYGEVDSVVRKWQQSLEKIDWETAVVVNGGDNHTWSLTRSIKYLKSNIKFYEFRVKDHQPAQEKIITQRQKHQDDFVAEITENKGFLGLEFNLKFPEEKLKINLPVPGIYHVYDFLAASSAYRLLNLPLKDINDALQGYLPAFGRVEKIVLTPPGRKHKIEAFIFLIKNPAGAAEVLDTIMPEMKANDRLLIALNDNLADGTDVSWIWDVNFEVFRNSSHSKLRNLIVCSGNRAADMAVRLKYASIQPECIHLAPDIAAALNQVQSGLTGRLFILPTYTALLRLQQILAKRGIKKHYWKETL
ncbi:MAG: MurT ligase domain-containing protein, partial [Firmicutes bacterium]|nr:MurT ligase domain-containing protein [Bacillota bacterium]